VLRPHWTALEEPVLDRGERYDPAHKTLLRRLRCGRLGDGRRE
jgi:hypothetical protein